MLSFEYLQNLTCREPRVFIYLVQVGAAVITSLIISMMIGKRVILYLKRKQVGEVVGIWLEGQYRKQERLPWAD